MLEGGCACGAVRYAAGLPFDAMLCHCVDCRRVSAAPATAWFTVKLSDFRWTGGAASSRASSPAASRSFCASCGTQLTFRSIDTPEDVDVATCSLDDPSLVPPRRQAWIEQRLPWLALDLSLPSVPRGG